MMMNASNKNGELMYCGVIFFDFISGMFHSGIGHTQMSNLVSTLEIRELHHTCMKDREKEVSPHVQVVASGSCKKALIDEQSYTKEYH